MQLHMFWALYIHAADAQGVKDDWEKQREVFEDLKDLKKLFWRSPILGEDDGADLGLRHVPTLAKTLIDYCTRGAYDEFWAAKENDFPRFWHEHADIPATMTTGWYDPFPVSFGDYFATMTAQNESPQRLIIGPWSHVGMRGDASWTLDVDFGPTSVWGVQRYFEEQLAFFEPGCRTTQNGLGRRGAGEDLRDGRRQRPQDGARQARPRRRAGATSRSGRSPAPMPTTLLPARRRQAAPETPAADAAAAHVHASTPTTRCRRSADISAPSVSSRRLRRDRADVGAALNRRFCPQHLTPGPADQKESADVFTAREPYQRLSERADVLVFQTDPLRRGRRGDRPGRGEPLGLVVGAGHRLHGQADRRLPAEPRTTREGFDLNLDDSIIRMRYREGSTGEGRADGAGRGRTSRRSHLYPTSNVFAKGHRIRVDVSSSNFPRLRREPEHRRADRPAHAPRRRGADGLRGCGAPVEDRRVRDPCVSGLDFVRIPGGPFAFGEDPAALYPPGDDETPRRVVRVDGFRISRLPVCGDDGVPLTYLSRHDAGDVVRRARRAAADGGRVGGGGARRRRPALALGRRASRRDARRLRDAASAGRHAPAGIPPAPRPAARSTSRATSGSGRPTARRAAVPT